MISSKKMYRDAAILTLIVITLLNTVETLTSNLERNELLKRLFDTYDGNVRPNGINGTGPTLVNISFYIRSINDFNTKDMDYEVQLNFKMQWMDKRLAYDKPKDDRGYLTVPNKSLSAKLWLPDVFFSNEKNIRYHETLARNEYYWRIFPNGEVLYSTRLTLKLSCEMNFKRIPFDAQMCGFRISSYGFTTDDIQLKYKSKDPVQVTAGSYFPNFELEFFQTDYCNSQTTTEVYSCLRLDFLFSRVSTKHLQEIYLPMITTIGIIWLSFWLHPIKTVIPRCIILMTSFLYFQYLVHSLKQDFPKTSYITLLDRWIDGCFRFVLWSIIEFVIVTYLANINNEAEKHSLNSVEEPNRNDEEGSVNKILTNLHLKKDRFQSLEWYMKLDILNRFIFPILFTLFLIMYYFKSNVPLPNNKKEFVEWSLQSI